MKVIVLKSFRDKRTKKVYSAKGGENIIEMSKKRFDEAKQNLEKFGGGFIDIYTEVSDNQIESEG